MIGVEEHKVERVVCETRCGFDTGHFHRSHQRRSVRPLHRKTKRLKNVEFLGEFEMTRDVGTAAPGVDAYKKSTHTLQMLQQHLSTAVAEPAAYFDKAEWTRRKAFEELRQCNFVKG